MRIIDHLRQVDTSGIPDSEFAVRAVWKFQGYSSLDRVASSALSPAMYAFLLTLTAGGIGVAYCDHDPEIPSDWVGRDARELVAADRYLEVSRLDSIHSNLKRTPFRSMALEGSASVKADQRADIVAREVRDLADSLGIGAPRVVLFGAVGKFVERMHADRMILSAADLNPALIGRNLGPVTVVPGASEEALIQDADIALITGMTIANDTMDDLFSRCLAAGTRMVVFAETGGWFGPTYCKLGIDAVVSEQFPVYIVPGTSVVNIYRRSR